MVLSGQLISAEALPAAQLADAEHLPAPPALARGGESMNVVRHEVASYRCLPKGEDHSDRRVNLGV